MKELPLKTEASSFKAKVKTRWHVMKNLFNDYTAHSTVHGVSYITEPGRSSIERAWWICVLSISVLICGKLIFDTTNISPIIISFKDRPTPIWEIPFPAVTICPRSVTNWSLTEIHNNGEEYFKSLSENEKLQTLAKNAFCDLDYLESLSHYTDCNDCLKIIRKIKIAPKEMFVECKFMNEIIGCTEFLEETILDSKICYTFNGVRLHRQGEGDDVVADQKKTRRTFSAGPQYGFSILLRSHKTYFDQYCSTLNGFIVEYRLPHESPEFKSNFFALRMGNSMNIIVKPKMVVTSDELRGYPLQDRQCYFKNERRLEYFRQYTQSNCKIECEIMEIVKQCNRLPIFIENRRGFDILGPNQSACAKSSMTSLAHRNYQGCNCLQTCTAITFDSEIQTSRFNISTEDQISFSRLNIYFKETQFMTLQRTEIYGKAEFLANCGGLLGLCLGVSAISFVEIIFFCTVRLWTTLQGTRNVVAVETVFVECYRAGLNKTNRFMFMIRTLIRDYCAKTTLQGIKYMGYRGLSRSERICWTVVVGSSIFCGGALIFKVLRRYDQSPVIISYANEETLVSQIPFPAVTICSRIFAFPVMIAYNYFKVQNLSLYTLHQDLFDAMPAVAQVCDPALFGDIDPENKTDCEKCVDKLKTFSTGINAFGFGCSHLYSHEFCSDIFKPVVTEDGVCYEYNALQPFRYFPIDDITDNWTLDNGYRNNTGNVDIHPRAGSRMSLRVTIGFPKAVEDTFCKGAIQGLKVYLHMPNETPQMSKHFYLLPYTQMTVTASELRDFPVAKRQCYFSEERYLRFYRHYTQNNCETECLVNLTMSRCGCLVFYVPKIDGVKLCGISDISCQQATTQHHVEQSMYQNESNPGCHCLPTCTSITYDTEVNHALYSDDDIDLLYGGSRPGFATNYHIAILNVIFRENQFLTLKRSLLFGKTEILANCGGLLGLFLGFSFISVLELLYFCCLRFLCDMKLRFFK